MAGDPRIPRAYLAGLDGEYQRSKRRTKVECGQRRLGFVMVGDGSSMCGGSRCDVCERAGGRPGAGRALGAPLRWPALRLHCATYAVSGWHLSSSILGAAGGQEQHNFRNNVRNNFRNNFQNNFQNNFNTNLCHFGVILVVIFWCFPEPPGCGTTQLLRSLLLQLLL